MRRVGQDVTRSQCDGADLARARVRENERQRRTQASLPVYNSQTLEAHPLPTNDSGDAETKNAGALIFESALARPQFS
ncbi:hypothetical protein PC122_g14268 [Phytophthora cactorum]|nr:hypothetical protein PC122_g14268 [Phytophthora cactorum]